MSTPYLEVVLRKVRSLEGEQRSYYERVVTSIDTVPAFENKQNIAFMILAHCLEDLPEPLPQAMSETTFLTHMAKFLKAQQPRLSRLLFSPEFARQPAQKAREVALEFAAQVAEDLLDQYAAGTLEMGERSAITFKWPHYDEDAFPYYDPDDEKD